VGGTRNCDWWFTDEAVLLDTAGRYTTQDSDRKADSAAWLGFLALLKQFRPKRPLNGALVTVSVMDLLLWTKAERARYATHVRMRLSEMVAALESRFPVYVLVTKADMLAGFTDFFGDLDAAGRAQVWGTTFAMDIDPALIASPYTKDFDALEARLGAEMLARLHEERDLQRRASIYRFPQQFHAMGALVGEFLAQAFGTQVNHKPLWLRGAYFSSGTQEGNPIDRVLVALARSFRLERAAVAGPRGTGKSFFLTRLLREVIFGESGLAGADASLERRARRLRLLAYGAIATLALALGVLWTSSFFANRAFVAAAAAGAAAAKQALEKLGPPKPGDEAQLVRALDALRVLPGGYRDRQAGTVPVLDAGLSQAGKIGTQAVRAYRNALIDALFPRLALALENEIRQASRSSKQEGLRDALAGYQSLYAGKNADVKQVEAAARRAWRLPEAESAALLAHLRAGLEEGAPEMRHPQDEAIIRDARQKLAPANNS
jgi:type VI secretion system protein ImpL